MIVSGPLACSTTDLLPLERVESLPACDVTQEKEFWFDLESVKKGQEPDRVWLPAVWTFGDRGRRVKFKISAGLGKMFSVMTYKNGVIICSESDVRSKGSEMDP
jgi:hypothetical protein